MAAADELYSLLIPLRRQRLIVPRACVAEVVRYTEPAPVDGAPEWLRGSMPWQGDSIPVLCFEQLCGMESGAPGGRTRIAIFNALSQESPTPCYGVLAEGFPQLVRVNRDVLQLDERNDWPDSGPVICQVRMINEYPLIPDLEQVEALLAAAAGDVAAAAG